MTRKSEHDRIADRLAKKLKTKHLREGVDIKVRDKAIEVAATDSDIHQSLGQLRRSRKTKKYLVVPQRKIKKAVELTKDSGIGVMSPSGRIVKKPRRKSR